MASFMKFPIPSAVILVTLALGITSADAGRYPSTGVQTFTYADGTTVLGDGTTFSSTYLDGMIGFAKVNSNSLQIASQSLGGNYSALRIPNLDVGNPIQSFDASVNLKMVKGASATAIPGAGWALCFGAIPSLGDGAGDIGYTMNGGIVISFDTYADTPNDRPSIDVYCNNTVVGSFLSYDLNETSTIAASSSSTFTLTNPETGGVTVNMAATASASVVQARMRAVSGWNLVTVTGTPGNWTVTHGSFNSHPNPVANAAGLVGLNMAPGFGAMTVTNTVDGNATTKEVWTIGGLQGRGFVFDTNFRPLTVHWDYDGLDLSFNGQTIFTNLATPGFSPTSGNAFAITASTAGGDQDTFLDDLLIQTSPASPPDTGGPIISEFMAENKDTLEDEDMETSDWIEIYNGQNAAVDLAGYQLVQGATTWTFPSVSLAAYGHLVVFASGKNRTANTAMLHTNFTLPKTGGTFSLRNPALTVISSWTYPNQFEDVSYGLKYQGGASGFLSPVSPRAGTLYSYDVAPNGPAEDVVWSSEGGLITTATPLSVTAPLASGAVVRYTLDNTNPSPTSALYSTALNLANSTTVRARVYTPGHLPGNVSSRTLLMLDSSLANYNGSGQSFKSHLPLIVLDSMGTNVDGVTDSGQARPHRFTYGVVIDKDATTGLADITSPITNWQGRGGTHVRGDSSSGFAQKSYAWETWDNLDNDKDAALLDLPAESDWALYGPFTDKTFIRNLVTYTKMRELHGDADGFAMRTRMVEVIFNMDPGQAVSYNDYRGVYILMERIKRSKDRMNIAKLTDQVTDPALITGGYIFRRDRVSADGTTLLPVGMNSHTPGVLNAAQTTYLSNYINAFNNALNGPNFTDPVLGYAPYIDVNSFIENWWFVEITKQIDGYRLSTYFTKDRGGKITATPIWDYNLSLGNAYYAVGDQYAGWYWNLGDTYWWARLRQDPAYELKNWDRYWEMRRTIFNTASLQNSMDQYKLMATNGSTTPVSNNFVLTAGQSSTMENAAQRHYRKYPVLGTYLWPNAGGPPNEAATLTPRPWEINTTYQSEVDWMKTWIGQRLNWIDDQNFPSGSTVIYRPPVVNPGPGSVPVSSQINISRYAGTPPGGYSYAAGGTLYYTLDGTDPSVGAAFPTETELISGASNACRWLVPSAANGGFTLTAGAGAQQWTNYTAPVNDANWTAATTGIGYDVGEGNYTTLISASGNTGTQMQNINATCYVRVPFTIADAATLAAINTLNLGMKYDDGFIAYINGVKVAGANDTDGSVTTDPSTALSPVARDEGAAVNFETFNISSAGIPALRVGSNMLAIHCLNGVNNTSSDLLMVPKLTWLPVNTSTGGGIVYTGSITLNNSATLKTRLLSNGIWSPLTTNTYVVDAVPASATNLVISEIHYHPTGATLAEVAAGFTSARDFEFIELLNVSTQNVDLSNCAFTDGITYGFGSANPAALTLAPGGRAIIVANLAAFISRNGNNPAVRILGEFSGSLNNAGETVTLLAASASVIASFTYLTSEPWPVDADGPGYSLLLNNPAANPAYGAGTSWRSSSQIGGSPGNTNSNTFTGSNFGDTDNDGSSDFLEYAMGSSQSSPESTPQMSHNFVVDPPGADPGTYLTFQYTRNLAADGVILTPQESSDLGTWNGAGMVYVSTVNQANGTALITCRSATPISGPATRNYLRVLVTPAVP
jgi:hypothetical protein